MQYTQYVTECSKIIYTAVWIVLQARIAMRYYSLLKQYRST